MLHPCDAMSTERAEATGIIVTIEDHSPGAGDELRHFAGISVDAIVSTVRTLVTSCSLADARSPARSSEARS